jgi:thioredoxin-like negative regulator of GroEL
LERIAGRYLGRVLAYRIDLDDNTSAGQRFGVTSLPAVLALVDG